MAARRTFGEPSWVRFAKAPRVDSEKIPRAQVSAAAARTPDVTGWGGIPFGATVWLVADEMGMPLAGLSKPPTEHPLSDHVSAFATHIVYGTTTECVRRALARLM